MNEFDLANLRELVGFWSWLAIGCGLIGAWVSMRVSRKGKSDRLHFTPAMVERRLAAAMLLLACFIYFVVLPSSIAYSGPIHPEIRFLWRFDKYFASMVALTFGAAFGFDSLRLSCR